MPTEEAKIAYRQKHLIPEGVDLAFANFPEFLEARKALIRDRLKKNCKDNEDNRSIREKSLRDQMKIIYVAGGES